MTNIVVDPCRLSSPIYAVSGKRATSLEGPDTPPVR